MKIRNRNWNYPLIIMGTLLLVVCSCKKDNSDDSGKGSVITFGSMTDQEGNTYKTVIIGSQTWMAENLRTTKFNDNTDIPKKTGGMAQTTLYTPGYCTYDNTSNTDLINTYGCLYNWYTVNTGKLAPKGWHVPSDADWTTLETYLKANGYNYDGDSEYNKIAKALASSKGWTASIVVGTVGNNDYPLKINATGFTAFPGGFRSSNGAFYNKDIAGYWWSLSEINTANAWIRNMRFDYSGVNRTGFEKDFCISVRCVKD